MKKFLRILGIIIVLIAVFFVIKTQTTRFGSTPTTTLANPASVNCIDKGGTLEILEGTGGQYGMCTLPDGTTCEERAYFRGECPVIETGNTFVYQPLGLSLTIPTGRTAKEDTINPCGKNSCKESGIYITTDMKDASGYNVFAFLTIQKINHMETQPTDTILIDQPGKKLFQIEGISGLGSFVLTLAGEYYSIQIFYFNSEQPMPAGYDDMWAPYQPNEKDIDNVIHIIKSIRK